jgi:calcineurin-like phosphoesterase family protein
MNLYISDLHFGHANVIRFDHRPFADVEEMDHVMIQLWNSRVSGDDDVFIVGDFCHKSGKTPDWYLRQLRGHKHLIIGNHDKVMLDCENAAKYIESVDKMLYVQDNDKAICLCHFPIADWNKARHGSWHIYGHIHASKADEYQFMKTRERALNAAACINNYTPSSVNELIRNNEAFQAQDEAAELLYVGISVEDDRRVTFTLDDIFEGLVTRDMVMDVRPASISDRNYPRLVKNE